MRKGRPSLSPPPLGVRVMASHRPLGAKSRINLPSDFPRMHAEGALDHPSRRLAPPSPLHLLPYCPYAHSVVKSCTHSNVPLASTVTQMDVVVVAT